MQEKKQNGLKIFFYVLAPLPGPKPKASDANFDDLLSGQGFSGTKEKKGPRTIAEMRKEEMAKEMDPEKLKAGDFVFSDGIMSNIRLLIKVVCC